MWLAISEQQRFDESFLVPPVWQRTDVGSWRPGQGDVDNGQEGISRDGWVSLRRALSNSTGQLNLRKKDES